MAVGENIRVCHVLHGIVGGGSEQVVLNYCSRMRDIHFDVLFQYEPNPRILERFDEVGINCIQIPDKVHHPLKHLWMMFWIFRKGHYNVIHCHLDWFMNSYVCFLAMLAGVKKRLAHHHQAYLPKNPLLILLCVLLRIPNKLFATHWLACGEAAAVNGWGQKAIKNGFVTMLPNAIDPEQFKYDEAARRNVRSRLGIAEDDFVMGHVGRFYPQKNHEFLIDMFSEFHKQESNAKLLLLGDGPLQESIRRKVRFLGLEQFVVFAGLQKNPASFYNAMDVFCFPSLWEGLPLTLVEAQYNGLPCIISDRVTKEVVITDNVYSISNGEKYPWIDLMKKLQTTNITRSVNIRSTSFDINQRYKILESLYQFP